LCQMAGPGSPFKSTLVLADESRIAIQFRNRAPKPYWRSTSKRNGQGAVLCQC
jgi:hypothetical protein